MTCKNIEIVYHRTREWCLEQAAQTGEDYPIRVTVDIKVRDLSIQARRVLLNHSDNCGEFPESLTMPLQESYRCYWDSTETLTPAQVGKFIIDSRDFNFRPRMEGNYVILNP